MQRRLLPSDVDGAPRGDGGDVHCQFQRRWAGRWYSRHAFGQHVATMEQDAATRFRPGCHRLRRHRRSTFSKPNPLRLSRTCALTTKAESQSLWEWLTLQRKKASESDRTESAILEPRLVLAVYTKAGYD